MGSLKGYRLGIMRVYSWQPCETPKSAKLCLFLRLPTFLFQLIAKTQFAYCDRFKIVRWYMRTCLTLTSSPLLSLYIATFFDHPTVIILCFVHTIPVISSSSTGVNVLKQFPLLKFQIFTVPSRAPYKTEEYQWGNYLFDAFTKRLGTHSFLNLFKCKPVSQYICADNGIKHIMSEEKWRCSGLSYWRPDKIDSHWEKPSRLKAGT